MPEASEKDYYKKHVKVERQKWFGCACCPPNVARLLSSIGGYAYEYNEKEFFMNMFIGGSMHAVLDGKENQFKVETDYPWNGDVKIQIENEEDTAFTYAIRVPGWCRSYTLKLNGEAVSCPVENGYLLLERCWKNQDEIVFSMEMPVELVAANPRVREDIGKVAVMRGPVVYCLEEADNGDQLQELYLNENPEFAVKYEKDLLKGVVTLTTEGKRLSEEEWDEKTLYKTYAGRKFEPQTLKFIPYYAWTNRTVGEMLVWVRI